MPTGGMGSSILFTDDSALGPEPLLWSSPKRMGVNSIDRGSRVWLQPLQLCLPRPCTALCRLQHSHALACAWHCGMSGNILPLSRTCCCWGF